MEVVVLVVSRAIKLLIEGFGGLCLFVTYEEWGVLRKIH